MPYNPSDNDDLDDPHYKPFDPFEEPQASPTPQPKSTDDENKKEALLRTFKAIKDYFK